MRETVGIKEAGKILGPRERPWSVNTIKRRMAKDPTFPKPWHDGFRLQWWVDELINWKETQPRAQHYRNDLHGEEPQ